MAEQHSELISEVEVLERAVWRKWNKFTWSGLIIIGIGCVLIISGILMHTGAYSVEGLLVGFGAIIILIGLVRVFIGIINPALPSDLRARRIRRRRVSPVLDVVEEEILPTEEG